MKTIQLFLLLISVSITLNSCAKKGRPNGGPKDKDAPVVITMSPPYETLNFDQKEIKLYFDEFVTYVNISKQLVVSPPLKYSLTFSPIGTPTKSLTISIKDTLKENTTYTFNFGNSIKDYNENNELKGLKHVFSTGNEIDSLSISGSVSNAFKKDSLKNISVLLYEITPEFNDSIVFKNHPSYAINTNDKSTFKLENLKEGIYKVVAIEDKDDNLLYNPKTERIGFFKDNILLNKDTTLINSIRVFKETPKFKFSRPKELSKGHIVFPFTGSDEGNIKLISKIPDSIKNVIQLNKQKDKNTFLVHTI